MWACQPQNFKFEHSVEEILHRIASQPQGTLLKVMLNLARADAKLATQIDHAIAEENGEVNEGDEDEEEGHEESGDDSENSDESDEEEDEE